MTMDKQDLNAKVQEEMKKEGKVSYETLAQIAATLEQERNSTFQQLKKVTEERDELKKQETFLYMDWMWRVITNDTPFISSEFRAQCAEQLQSMFNFTASDTAAQEDPVQEETTKE